MNARKRADLEEVLNKTFVRIELMRRKNNYFEVAYLTEKAKRIKRQLKALNNTSVRL